MAITPQALQEKTDGSYSLPILFDNGDLKALEDIQKKWRFKDKASLLKFAMALLLKAENNHLTITVNGNETPAAPAKDLLDDSIAPNA